MCWRKVGVLALLAMAMAFVHADYFVAEACSWGFGILFVLLFFVGKAQNRKIADKWLEEAEPVLRTQFSYTGSSVENGMGLLEESRSNFKYFCTGRRFLTRFVADLETIDVGLHGEDVDPFILGICKKLGFTALSKIFPELIETAKQVPVKEVPESMWVSTDCTEIPKAALTHSIQAVIIFYLKGVDFFNVSSHNFLEYIVITDMNKQLIIGMPRTQKHVLRVRFKLQVGSKKLDVPKALQLVFALVDGAGATIKLSPNAKHSAIKRRLKIKQAAEALASAQEDTGSLNDRLIADFLLGQGYLESAKIIEETKDVGHLVDHELHSECQAVLKDLQAHHTDKAIAWCSQNGSRLRRLQSSLEFHLRLQDFIEFVRAHKPLEAVQHARTYLTPLAMQPEKQSLRDAAIGEVQIAMATLAFESPEKCGIEAYEKVFAMDRWLTLEKMFRKAFNDVYGMHDPPSLCIALHAGLSTLNTRACHLTRDTNLKARLAQSGARGKRQRREGEEAGDDNGDSEDESEEWFKSLTASEKDDSANSKKRKYSRAELPVPICPACSEVGSQLCTGLPFAYHPHSRLVCRVTQSVMDEHNPPLVLPNGRVYSKRGIELLTQRSSDGTIKCVDTQDVFSPTDVKPVYIL
ncbi:Leucine-rich repeat-containing protein 56 [Phytophthora nicotianae]|uniref:Leucine-rich repeat-containing protein 56 n=1 Tax=Phytophthora nicotianae TaxID=4792 RepID=A0A0W8DMB3_PHYNI|nr:Leucine-rich repeat-containing protein 56 [Phytophthora nicotianae]